MLKLSKEMIDVASRNVNLSFNRITTTLYFYSTSSVITTVVIRFGWETRDILNLEIDLPVVCLNKKVIYIVSVHFVQVIWPTTPG